MSEHEKTHPGIQILCDLSPAPAYVEYKDKPLLSRTLAWLKAGGDDGKNRFDMTHWYDETNEDGEVIENDGDDYYSAPVCGSACCIGGYAAYVAGEGIHRGGYRDLNKEISDADRQLLFFLRESPNGKNVGGLSLSQITPEMAAEALEDYLEGEPIDWPRIYRAHTEASDAARTARLQEAGEAWVANYTKPEGE